MADRRKNTMLMSVRPQFAKKIFDGTKTVELRRTRPRLVEGDRVFVYVSSPVKSLAGWFESGGVMAGSPAELWSALGEHTGVTRNEFDSYFSGTDVAYGIKIRTSHELEAGITLKELRTMLGNFHPPQGYYYLAPLVLSKLDSRMRGLEPERFPAAV